MKVLNLNCGNKFIATKTCYRATNRICYGDIYIFKFVFVYKVITFQYNDA